MTKLALILLLGSAALVASACAGNGSDNDTRAETSNTTATTTTVGDDTEALERAVRDVLRANHRLSKRVLWTNTVPSNAASTGGPALAALRDSAADRRRRGIRVRVVSEEFRILSIELDPSYATATATVFNPQRVQPHGRSGRPLGKPVNLRERVRFELRRVDSSVRFVVWRVVPIQ
jgi:hypothetical protein